MVKALHYWSVPAPIPGGVTGDFFHGTPLTEPCALRSTQPLKVSTRDFSWSKGGWCVWLPITSRKSGALTYPEPLGPPWPVMGDLYFTYCVLCVMYDQLLNTVTAGQKKM